MGERVEIVALYPYRDGESATDWTNRVLAHAGKHGTNRQCSISWHDECSERHLGADAECMCLCHDPAVSWYSVEGHSEGGTVVVLRSEEGQHSWPPQEGEPETMWAWYVLAYSAEDASVRATKMQEKILEERAE